MKYLVRLFFLLVVFFAQSFFVSAFSANLTVVSTVPPVGMLVEAIGGRRIQNEVLLKANMSLHGYSLRPSDVKTLKNADIVFWVSPDLERFLSRLLQQSSAPLWEADDEHTTQHILPYQEHDHTEEEDFHVWLDPSKARMLAKEITRRLSQKDPEGQEYFQERLVLLSESIDKAEQEIHHLIDEFSEKKLKKQWIIQHQAYSHLIAAYELPQPLVFSLVPEHQPGLRELMGLKQKLLNNRDDEVCVILEGNLSDKPLQPLLKGRAYKSVVIDALGFRFTTYPEFLMATVNAWLYCGSSAKE